MMAVETIMGISSGEMTRSRTAPAAEPTNVKVMRSGNRRRFTILVRRNGKVPPTLMKVNANIFVAIATRASIPNWNMDGTVITEVLPVITPMPLDTKKTAIKRSQ